MESSSGSHTSVRDSQAPVSTGASASLVWSDARVLGFGPMDQTHEEFFRVTFDLLTCTFAGAADALRAFEDHAVEHFEQENEWMEKSLFPARDCHIAEHAAVLLSVREVGEGFTSGALGLDTVHDLAMELFSWFPGHADYLDSALAAWMTRRNMGGTPVVMRRSLRA